LPAAPQTLILSAHAALPPLTDMSLGMHIDESLHHMHLQ